MKPLLFAIPIAMLASCASKPQQRIVPITPEMSGRTLKRGETASVRHGEVIKAYPVGRYMEPRKPGVMHEAHTIYRVEKTPRWNLTRPAGARTIAIATPPPSRATAAPSGSELTVELNRQRQATQAVIQGGQIVSDKLTEMTAALQQNRILAEQNAAMRKELQDTHQRLETLEKKVSEPPAPAPAPLSDEPW